MIQQISGLVNRQLFLCGAPDSLPSRLKAGCPGIFRQYNFKAK
jgi:hypothetical protein